MACIFRLNGENLRVDDLLSQVQLNPLCVYRKGEPVSNRLRAKPSEISGFNVLVSDADFDDFRTQTKEAIEWLENNKLMLAKAIDWPGVSGASLDFGIYMRNVFCQFDYFPPTLVKLAGALRLGLELSQYPQPRRPGKRIKNFRRLLAKRVPS